MRATLRRLHRWLGLALLLPLLAQGVSGTILVLDQPWSGDAVLMQAAPGAMNALLAASRAIAPAGMRVARIAPAPDGGVATVQFAPQGRARGGGVTAQIDTARLTQVGPMIAAGGAMEWVRGLHNNLLVPEYGGRSILGWEGVGLLLLLVFGIPLWWPRPGQLRAAFTVPFASKGVGFQRRLHGAVAIWVLPVLLVSTVTGITMGFPQATRQMLGVPAGGPPRATPGPAAPLPDLDHAVQLAWSALPGRGVRMLLLPNSANDPIRLFMLAPGASAGATTMSSVSVSADGGRVIAVQDGGAVSAAESVLRWAHDLHQGQGLGPAWRFANAFAGLALPLLGFTGIAMWLLKRRNRRRSARDRLVATQSGN
jgi:uncharacterized iron-regulated membrane protein